MMRGRQSQLCSFIAEMVVAAISFTLGCTGDDDHPNNLDPTALPGRTAPLPDSQDGRLHGSDCPIEAPTNQEIACGVLTVPKDYQDAGAGTLALSVLVFRGHGSASPVVYLEGGPGGAAATSVTSLFEYFAPLLEERDLVVLDQRGTGYSTPQPTCSVLDDNSDLTDSPEQIQNALDQLAHCSETLKSRGLDPKVFTTHANANDVELLRRALGYSEWNLFGVSYGTRLALDVMRYFPTGVKSVVLDSVLPPQVDWQTASAVNAQRAFDRIFEHCRAQPRCDAAYPNLETQFYSTIDDLNAAPVPLRLSDGSNFLLTGDQALQLLFLISYDATAVALIPEVIAQFAEGEFRVVVALKEAELDGAGGFPAVSLGMYLSIVCSEYVAYENVADVEAANAEARPQVSRVLGDTTLFDICSAWNVPPAPAVEREAVSSDIPTLVLSGAYDPVTPIAWGELVSQTLSRSHFLSFEGAAHGVFTDVCGARLLDAFWRDPSTNPASACPERNQDLTFEVLRAGGRLSASTTRSPLSLVHESSIAELVLERLEHRVH